VNNALRYLALVFNFQLSIRIALVFNFQLSIFNCKLSIVYSIPWFVSHEPRWQNAGKYAKDYRNSVMDF
jgi:hypothetical protein